MVFARVAPAFWLCLLAPAFAQMPLSDTPSDTKAYSAANALADPEQKIAALLKFKANFPDSILLSTADQSILLTLIRKLPGQPDRIRQAAAEIYRRTPERNRASIANTLALQLLAADLLLPEARRYARASVDAKSMSAYVREQLAAYEERGQIPPWSQELERRYRELRAGRVATLGRVELKLGNTAQAKKLLEEAHAVLPGNVPVQAGLGELALKAGDPAKAIDYLVAAQLSGTAPKEATTALQSIYRSQHNDSLAGFDAMLDAEYRKRFPNPVRTDPWRPSSNRSDRVVLAEVFTGAGCPPCAATDLAFDAAMQRYPRKDLAILMYHQHVPRPDPMSNPDTLSRYRSYGANGVPTFAIDGRKVSGGGPREVTRQMYDRVVSEIERDLETPAEAVIRAEASFTGNAVRVKATVDRVSSDSPDLKLQIALVEKELRFSGENGVRFHPMVVRAMAGKNGDGFAVQSSPATFEQSFGLNAISNFIKDHLETYEAAGYRGEPFTFAEKMDQIRRDDLAVVIFVHDAKTQHVLQAVYLDQSTGGGRQ